MGGCKRSITKDGNRFIISGTSSVEGTKDCLPGKKVKSWNLVGTLPNNAFGSMDVTFREMTIDFSPKGGPKDIKATLSEKGVSFPDGNTWVKMVSMPMAAQDYQVDNF